MTYTHDETQYLITMSDTGGVTEYRHGEKANIVNGDIAYDTIIPLSIESDMMYSRIFQLSNIIVVGSDFGASIAFDISVIRYMMETEELGVNGTIYTTLGNGGVLIKPTIGVSSLLANSSELFFGLQSIQAGAGSGNAMAITEPVEGGEIIGTVSGAEYETLIEERPESTDESFYMSVEEHNNEHCYAILLPIENTQHIQLKERE